MLRVARPGGLACVFDHNPFNPLTRRAVSNCDFDTDAVLLTMRRTAAAFSRAGATIEDRRYYLFTPFEGRPVACGERLLRRVPLGGQYVVAGRPIVVVARHVDAGALVNVLVVRSGGAALAASYHSGADQMVGVDPVQLSAHRVEEGAQRLPCRDLIAGARRRRHGFGLAHQLPHAD